MARFYSKNWFPYIFPFLLCFILTQAAIYASSWSFHLATAKIFVGGGLLWVWRDKFLPEINRITTKKQRLISALFGIFGAAIWIICQHFNVISLQENTMPNQWPIALIMAVTVVLSAGYVVVMPIISEIFWRSFMLRYLIEQDFKSIPIGTFQLFSFLGVILITAIPAEYSVAVASVTVLQNILIVWQKNLRCCIVSSMVTHAALIVYLLSNNYQLM